MTDRDRLIELFEAVEKDPAITCPHYKTDKTCDTCEYTINNFMCNHTERMVDYLLANGVIVPPCKVGDIYYTIEKYCNTDPYVTEKELVKPWDCERFCGRDDCSFREYRIEEHRFNSVIRILEAQKYFGVTIFLTKEEAEEKLKELNNNAV